MSRREQVDQVAARIVRDLADGRWHHAVGLGGWGVDRSLVGDALNVLARAERIDHDTRRNVYRLMPRVAPRQTTIYEEAQ